MIDFGPHAGLTLAAYTKGAYDRKSKYFRMWTVGIARLLAGLLLILILLLPRILPFSTDSRVASFVMGQDRINAAYAMIDSVESGRVKRLKCGGQFYDAGGGEIAACLEQAKKMGKDQKCTVTVPAPE